MKDRKTNIEVKASNKVTNLTVTLRTPELGVDDFVENHDLVITSFDEIIQKDQFSKEGQESFWKNIYENVNQETLTLGNTLPHILNALHAEPIGGVDTCTISIDEYETFHAFFTGNELQITTY